MSQSTAEIMDENTRRYYLDAMGIQCWQLLDVASLSENKNDLSAPEGNTEVAVGYAAIESEIQSCRQCVLHETRKQALAGRGNQSAELMFVVLSPSESDEQSGLVCSGEAGALFSKMLAAIDINIENVYISALLKCRVPENHTISPNEIQSCQTHLKQQIEFIQPKLLVVLGETTARCLLQKEQTIDQSREMNHALSQQLDSVPLFFSYSPNELLQQADNKRKAWADLQQLKKIIANIN